MAMSITLMFGFRVFCPTGDGGGVDNSCGSAGSGPRAWPSKIADIEVDGDIADMEEAWAGGVADLGDPRAAEAIKKVPGYRQYKEKLDAALRDSLGDKWTMARAMERSDWEDLSNGFSPTPAISATFNRDLAYKWPNLAQNKGRDMVVVEFPVEPVAVIMRGSKNEAELVLDPSWIDWSNVSASDIRSKRAFCPTGAGGGIDNSCSSKGGEGGEIRDERVKKVPGPILGDKVDFKVLHERLQSDGGFTWEGVSQRLVKRDAKIVSPYPERAKVFKSMTDIKPKDIAEYVAKNFDKLSDANAKAPHFIGGWRDDDTGQVFLDVSIAVKSAEDARRVALDNDQIAYYDLDAGTSVTVNRDAKGGARSLYGEDASHRWSLWQADGGDGRGVLPSTDRARAHRGRNGRGAGSHREATRTDGLLIDIAPLAFALRAFCATGEGGGVDNSCSSRGDGVVDASRAPVRETPEGVKVIDMNSKARETYGEPETKQTDPYRNDKLKKPRATELPIGEIKEREDGTLDIEFASKAAEKSYEQFQEDSGGLTINEVRDNFEQLLKDSDPRDADWYHQRFEEQRAYAKQVGMDQRTLAAMVAVTSPRQTFSEIESTKIQKTKDWEPGPGREGITRQQNFDVAKQVVSLIQRDIPMRYKGKMVRPSDKDKDGNFIIPARDLFMKTKDGIGIPGTGHPDAPRGMYENLTKAARLMRGEVDIDDGLGREPKVRSFYSNMIRPWDSEQLTVDGLMAQAMQPKTMPLHTSGPKKGQPAPEKLIDSNFKYSMVSGVVRHLAKKYGMKPHEVQARIWTQWRRAHPKESRAQRTRIKNRLATRRKAAAKPRANPKSKARKAA
jgi:hypothetical protein